MLDPALQAEMQTLQDANLDVLLATLTILQSLVILKFAIKTEGFF
jgi:hypothetical protein